MARGMPPTRRGGVWIHGASVGEARIVAGLARELRAARPELPLVVTAHTPAGRTLLPAPADVDAACFAPLDFPGLPTRAIRAIGPALLVLVETELWPNLLRECDRAGVPVVVVNARLSDRRMVGYRRLAGLFAPLLARLERVGARSADDARRLRELGVREDALEVTGDVKYDLPAPPCGRDETRRRYGVAAERPVVVAGSTREGEEEQVLAAFLRARRLSPDMLLVLAPRHTERCNEIERSVARSGLRCARLPAAGTAARADADVLLVDSVGVLAALYTMADAAFVGGSLVAAGGHNVLEPAAAGVPVLFGPHTENFRDAAAELERAGAATRAPDAAALGDAFAGLIADPAAARRMGLAGRRVVESNRGALARDVRLILSVLERNRAALRAEAP